MDTLPPPRPPEKCKHKGWCTFTLQSCHGGRGGSQSHHAVLWAAFTRTGHIHERGLEHTRDSVLSLNKMCALSFILLSSHLNSLFHMLYFDLHSVSSLSFYKFIVLLFILYMLYEYT